MIVAPQGAEADHAEFPAGRIRYYRAGTTGPAVVLLHGGALDNGLLSWRHTIPVLSVDHQVFVPDLPGQGGSLPWRGRANQRTCEELLRWLLDSWGVQDAVLIGHSMGGSIASGFALRNHHRVRGLVLVDSAGMQARLEKHLLTYLLLRSRFVGPAAARLLAVNRKFVRALLTANVFAGEPTDLDEIATETLSELRHRGSLFSDWHHESITWGGMNVNHLPFLHQIHCRAMVIHGEHDKIVPVTCAREAASSIPGAALRVISGAGHWPNREKPAEFNAVIREFVNGRS